MDYVLEGFDKDSRGHNFKRPPTALGIVGRASCWNSLTIHVFKTDRTVEAVGDGTEFVPVDMAEHLYRSHSISLYDQE